MTDPPSTICFVCGYNMHDRARGDLCPECSVPFDDRPDWPNEKHDALVIFWCGTGAIVLLFIGVVAPIFLLDGLALLGLVGMFLGFLTVAMASWPGPNPRTHRAHPRRKRYRLTGHICGWISVMLPFAIVAVGLQYA
jgi:hypothetical protein